MKHTLPIAIIAVAMGAAITGVISFQSGLFQTASIGELADSLTSSKTGFSQPAVDNTPASIVPDMPTPAPGQECNSTTTPWIRVLSPNGGEVYKPGSKITVKWVSCNIAPTEKVHVSLLWKNSASNEPGGIVAKASPNDVQEVITLPTDVGNGKYYLADNVYKVQVVQSNNDAPNYQGAVDVSDESFTISNKITKTQ